MPGVIELHLREVGQLFDSLDPCPFYDRDIDTDAEDYIVASVRELPERRASAIVVHIDEPSGQPNEQRDVEQAIAATSSARRCLRRASCASSVAAAGSAASSG